MMAEDLELMEHLPGNYYNFHPGSHVGQGVEEGCRQIAAMLDQVVGSELKTTRPQHGDLLPMPLVVGRRLQQERQSRQSRMGATAVQAAARAGFPMVRRMADTRTSR